MLQLGDQTRSAGERAQRLSSFMSHPASYSLHRDPLPDHEQKQAALSYLHEAWAEARHDGVRVSGWPVGTFLRGKRVMWQGELVTPSQGEPVRFLETLKQ